MDPTQISPAMAEVVLWRNIGVVCICGAVWAFSVCFWLWWAYERGRRG